MAKISVSARTRLKKVIYITIVYILISQFFTIYDYMSLKARGTDFGDKSLAFYQITNVLGSLLGGLLGGSFLVYILREKLIKRPFGQYLLISFITILLIIPIVSTLSTIIVSCITLQTHPFHSEVIGEVARVLLSPILIKM